MYDCMTTRPGNGGKWQLQYRGTLNQVLLHTFKSINALARLFLCMGSVQTIWTPVNAFRDMGVECNGAPL